MSDARDITLRLGQKNSLANAVITWRAVEPSLSVSRSSNRPTSHSTVQLVQTMSDARLSNDDRQYFSANSGEEQMASLSVLKSYRNTVNILQASLIC